MNCHVFIKFKPGKQRHINMTKDYGIDAFKFDAGEVVWLPDDFNFMQEYINPNEFTNKYVKVVSEPTYRDRIEVFFSDFKLKYFSTLRARSVYHLTRP